MVKGPRMPKPSTVGCNRDLKMGPQVELSLWWGRRGAWSMLKERDRVNRF